MASTIRCDIVSAEAEIFHGEAELIVATGEIGELGIAPQHAPLITRLKPGKVVVTLPGGEKLDFAISGGILEVQPQVVTVLADTAIRAQDIDEAAVLRRQGRGRAHPRAQRERSDGRRRSRRQQLAESHGAAAGAGAPAQEPEALRSRRRAVARRKRRPRAGVFHLRARAYFRYTQCRDSTKPTTPSTSSTPGFASHAHFNPSESSIAPIAQVLTAVVHSHMQHEAHAAACGRPRCSSPAKVSGR